jgi:hypothetical protein
MKINKSITYQLNNNVFVPYNTGVIVMDDICDDIYNDIFNESIMGAIERNVFSGCKLIIDSFGDSGKYGYDYSFIGDTHCTTFRFFNIVCTKDTYAVVAVSPGALIKLWINYELFSILGSKKGLCVVFLKKGNNCIVMEIPDTNKDSTFFLRISDYEVENDCQKTDSLLRDNMFPISNLGHTNHSGNHLYSNKKFVFAFFPDDAMNGLEKKAEIEITDVFENQIYLVKKFSVRRKQEIDISDFELKNEDDGNTLRATIKYVYSDGRTKSECIPLYKTQTDERLKRVSEKAYNLSVQNTVSNYDKLVLRQGYEYINIFGRELAPILAQATVLRNNIEIITKGNSLEDTLYSPGSKRVFFFNKMYNAVNYYRIYLPKDYSVDKKYPLIIIYSTLEYNDRARYFQNYTDESVIAVDISMRGMTLGSYIGETAIKIALNDLFNRYSIDMNRIYCTGASNGGGGAWAQLEAFPDMFAGGYIVSGHANLDLLCNLNNIQLLCLSSREDYMYDVAFEKPMGLLDSHPACTALEADSLTHQILEFVWFKEKFFKQLLSARRNPYPDTIFYKTICNRHRKSYWLEIHSIENGKEEGSISAEIKGGIIFIKCAGITGFTMTVPPMLRGMDLELVINDNAFLYEDCTTEKLHFQKYFDHESIACFRRIYDYQPIKNMHKGCGLLDVYFDPLSIVIPTNYSNSVYDTAVTYSEPYCNCVIPKIYIKYPIVDYDELSQSVDKDERSYIVIDDGSNHPLLQEIRKKARINCNANGWTYRGNVYNGRYCVQQVVTSPWNPDMNIHLISYSDENMLKKNLFTRKLVMPSYSGGRHKFLNNDALIFDSMGYHGILDYSCEPIDL